MKAYRCLICGGTYLGEDKPTNCPFCGVHQKHIVDAKDWKEEYPELTDVSSENLEQALKLEIDNAQFYACASKCANNTELQGMFKALSKIEKEHAETICKILRIRKPDTEERSDVCNGNTDENIKDSLRREKMAVNFYRKALNQATERRVKELFTSLIEIESDHIRLAKERIK